MNKLLKKQIKCPKTCKKIGNKTHWIATHKSFTQLYRQYTKLFSNFFCQVMYNLFKLALINDVSDVSSFNRQWRLVLLSGHQKSYPCFICIIKCTNVNSPQVPLPAGIYKVHQEHFFISDGVVQHSPWFTRAVYQRQHLLEHKYQPRSLFNLVCCHMPWFSNFYHLSRASSGNRLFRFPS